MGRMSELYIQMQDEFINTCDDLEQGNTSLLDSIIELREQRMFHEEMASNIKEVENKYQEDIRSESQEFGNEYKGVKFEFRTGGKIFSFKNIAEWNSEKENLKNIEEKYKSAWENAQKGNMVVSEDGEILELPEVTYRKDTMIIKLPKE